MQTVQQLSRELRDAVHAVARAGRDFRRISDDALFVYDTYSDPDAPECRDAGAAVDDAHARYNAALDTAATARAALNAHSDVAYVDDEWVDEGSAGVVLADGGWARLGY